MSKHIVKFNRTKWNALMQCICPQILGIISPRLWRKHSRMPGQHTHRLIWCASPNAKPSAHTNPYYKEPA